ncbi:hypothetical protein C8R45DRAFT_1133190 [Mycena sanguinolenta]|nr:hypothetical protein C8R45DRAFT_1133190 [Mycena sanguinolenta]
MAWDPLRGLPTSERLVRASKAWLGGFQVHSSRLKAPSGLRPLQVIYHFSDMGIGRWANCWRCDLMSHGFLEWKGGKEPRKGECEAQNEMRANSEDNYRPDGSDGELATRIIAVVSEVVVKAVEDDVASVAICMQSSNRVCLRSRGGLYARYERESIYFIEPDYGVVAREWRRLDGGWVMDKNKVENVLAQMTGQPFALICGKSKEQSAGVE